MLSFIFSYNRKKLLMNCAKELSSFSDVFIIDDHSRFTIYEYKHYKSRVNNGKKGFWRQWQKAFDIAKESEHDIFMFAPDDAGNFDVDRIHKMVEGLKGKWVINYFRDDRDECWAKFKPYSVTINGVEARQIGFMDCAIITNRETLEAINFTMPKIPLHWLNLNASSGVGKYLSKEFNDNKIPIYQPLTSLAQHLGNECSVMHPKERLKIPIVTK